jgi:hypothetical protein
MRATPPKYPRARAAVATCIRAHPPTPTCPLHREPRPRRGREAGALIEDNRACFCFCTVPGSPRSLFSLSMAQPFPYEPDTAPSPLSCTSTLAERDVVTPVPSRAVDDDGDKAGPTPRDGGAAGATGRQGAAMGEQGVRGGIALADARVQARAPVGQGSGPSEQEGRPSAASSTVYPLVHADFQAYNAETWRRMPADLRTNLSAWVAPVSPSGRAPESYGNSKRSRGLRPRSPEADRASRRPRFL